MEFAAPPPEFPRQYNEPRLSKVANSSLYERRAARPAIDDNGFNPSSAAAENNQNGSREMELSEKMGMIEVAQTPSNATRNMPAQRQVKELVTVIEAAEFAIRNQMEENEHLRSALRVTEWELQNSKMEHGVSRGIEDRSRDPYQLRQSIQRGGSLPALPPTERPGNLASSLRSAGNRDGYAVTGLQEEQPGSMIVHPTAGQPMEYQNGGSRGPSSSVPTGHQGHVSNGVSSGHKSNGRGGMPPLPPIVDTNSSGVSTPSSRSNSPSHARRRDAESETRPESGGQGLPQLPASEMSANHPSYHPSDSNHEMYNQQEVALRSARTQQEEINLLHKRLTESSMKEASSLSEKRILERRVAELRLAYDQQQQGLVDAASKALSYRQDVLEENIRLTYALQAADTERSVYITSLLPLLAEFDLQPTVTDAHSMVSAIKILVQHLRSELSFSEMQGKSKDFPFRQWRADLPYHTAGSYPSQSPPHGHIHGLEIVPQQLYAQPPHMPSSPPSPMHQASTWQSAAPGQFPVSASEHAQYGGSESLAPLHSSPQGAHFGQTYANHEGGNHQGVDRPQESAESDEPSSNGAVVGADETERAEPAPRSPRMPTLPEEGTSDDGDPIPAIKDLQIVGIAVLGARLIACGHSINGTALCMFQWVRHYQNGTTMYIEGAAQPEYIITADDCNTMIAIQCVPMDERNRRGEMMTVFANENRWITCDATMQDQIDNFSTNGNASFEVQYLVEGSPNDDWETVNLTLKRNSYELRRLSTTRRVVINEKYSSDVSIKIPVGHLFQCAITSHEGRSFYLEFRDNRNRDLGVLTFRLFQKTALDGKRGRRRGGIPWFS